VIDKKLSSGKQRLPAESSQTAVAKAEAPIPNPQSEQLVLGWREWLKLPALGIARIKAKIDTGARTSALHAFYVEPYVSNGEQWVRFGVHPHQNDRDLVVECQAPVKDRRMVSDSGGHQEERYVIETRLSVGGIEWDAEITLTDRDTMKFRMLLGRTAMRGRFLVNPALSYLVGKKRRRKRPKPPHSNKPRELK